MKRGQRDSRQRESDKNRLQEGALLRSIHFDDFQKCLFSAASEALHSVWLTNNSCTFPMTTEQGSHGVNSSTHNPLVGMSVRGPVGTVAVFFNAGPPRWHGNWAPFWVRAHTVQRDYTWELKGEEDSLSLSLSLFLVWVCVMDKTNHASYMSSASNVCLVLLGGRKSSRRLKKRMRRGKQNKV